MIIKINPVILKRVTRGINWKTVSGGYTPYDMKTEFLLFWKTEKFYLSLIHYFVILTLLQNSMK